MNYGGSPEWLCKYCSEPLLGNYKIVMVDGHVRRSCKKCNGENPLEDKGDVK